MSTVQTNRIQHSTGTGNNIVLSADGDTQVNSLNGGQLAGFRNQIINGNFDHWQRSIDKTANGYATADRWYQYGASSTNTELGTQVAQDAGINGVSTYSARIIKSTASGNSSIAQGIELVKAGDPGIFGVGTQWTLSYYSTTPIPDFNMVFTDDVSGTGATGGVSGDPGEIEIEDVGGGWKRYSRTVTIAAGPSASNTNLRVQLALNNPCDTKITGLMLEPGPVATPFEHRPIGTELALCQRYYQKHTIAEGGNAWTAGVTEAPWLGFPTTMRAAPTADATPTQSVNVTSYTSDSISVDGLRRVYVVTTQGPWRYDTIETLDAEL